MKKLLCALLAGVFACSPAVTCLAAENTAAKTAETEMNDTALPDLNDGSWYETMHTDFTKIQNMQQLREAGWAPSPHGLRNYEYWCDQMIEFTDNGLIVHSEQQTDHDCGVCGVQEGVLPAALKHAKWQMAKAICCFRRHLAILKRRSSFPAVPACGRPFGCKATSAAKSATAVKTAARSTFMNPLSCETIPPRPARPFITTLTTHRFTAARGNVTDTGKNLYDGKEHTYALKWTPTQYTMYVDGEAVWSSDYGGVAKTPEFLRLTTEIRDSGWGPYGQEIGQFENHNDGTNDFIIKDVKVYQNTAYEAYIKSPDDYRDLKKAYIAAIAGASIVGAAAVGTAAFFAVKAIIKKKKGS